MKLWNEFIFKMGFSVGIGFLTLGIAYAKPAVPAKDTATVATATKKSSTKAKKTSRVPANNDPGEWAQAALKGSFSGKDEKGAPCAIEVIGWGDDGPSAQAVYQEFSIAGDNVKFNKHIRTQFKYETVVPDKNDFHSKFLLKGDRYVTKYIEKKSVIPSAMEEKSKPLGVLNSISDPDRVAIIIYLHENLLDILGYRFVLHNEGNRSEVTCTINKPADDI